MELEQLLVTELTNNPGQKAAHLAEKLGFERQEVSMLLSSRLRDRFEQDAAYRWWPIGQVPRQEIDESALGFSNTPLARLCRYYLACLEQDDVGEVSTWARSQFGYDYVALEAMPSGDINTLLQGSEPAALLKSMQQQRGTSVLYLGYPICINRFFSKKGEPLYRLEPVLLLPIQFEHPNNRGAASLASDYPLINTAVLKRYTNADNNTLLTELIELERELGFSSTDAEIPELDEVAQRLYSIRGEWPWHESCDGGTLPEAPPINELDEAGIYNRAVLVSAERKPYTQGLENELRKLGRLAAPEYAQTALGQLVNNDIPKAAEVTTEPIPLVEILPMNTEQRRAIHRSLTESLTIITGPPGTGKSQVVTNLLVNSAWQKKKVLFASKNNKAVDVVETRINNLGPRPLLLRMGSNEYQRKLSDYLQELLSATAGPDEFQEYEETLAVHQKLTTKMAAVNSALEQVVKLRNRVDALEQSVEILRTKLGNTVFQGISRYSHTDIKHSFAGFFNTLSAADKSRQTLLIRLLWPFIRASRMQRLGTELASIANLSAEFGLSAPFEDAEEMDFLDYSAFAEHIRERLDDVVKISAYFHFLHELQKGESLESLNQQHRQLLDEIADNSNRLWISWLKVTPAKLSQTDRQLLTQYAATVEMVTNPGGGVQSKSIWRKFYSLTEKVSHLLPCWAVTSLSARGNLPFTAGYYDLVIFDEASQCDIASALPLLYRAKRAVVIGDQQQLAHISSIQENKDKLLLERFDLVENHLQWAYSWKSLFEMARSYAGSEDIVKLRDHHRSHANIINFSNEHFYGGDLRIATRYDRLKFPRTSRPGSPGVRWMDVKGLTNRPQAGGAVNRTEAEAVIGVLQRLLLEQGYQGSIGAVSPFRAQANLISELCARDSELQRLLDEAEFLSDTVHRFQGDERDVMLFSPVISEGTPGQSLGFLSRNGNLFNVAITRARAMLLVVGDQTVAKSCGVDYLESFSHYVERLSEETKTVEGAAKNDCGPTYPTWVDRSKVSEWEVILYETLYQAGIKAIPQYPIEQYLLDLAVVDGDQRLDIEVDGEHYHRNWTGELCRRDQLRNQRLYELGWDVQRFWVYEIRDELEKCVEKVIRWCEKSRSS